MGGGDDAHVHRGGLQRADGGYLALGQNPQQPRLRTERHVADFIEEQRAAMSLAHQPFLAFGECPGERAAFIAEQLALDQVFGQRRAIDGDEGPARPGTRGVNGLRQEFLAGAGFALHQNAHAGIEQPRHLRQAFLNGRLFAGNLSERRRKLVILVCLNRRRQNADGRGRHHLDEQAAAAGGHPHHIALDRMGSGEAGEAVDFAVEEIGERASEQLPRGAPVNAQFLGQKLPAIMIEADDAPGTIEHQHIFGVDFGQPLVRGELQDPVARARADEICRLDPVGEILDDLQGQILAGFFLGRAERRYVEHRREIAFGIEDRRHGAGQRNVGGVEMIALVHGQRLAGGDAGAGAVGAGTGLVPVGPLIESRLPQIVGGGHIADIVDGDAFVVGQKENVTQPRDLPVQRLDAEAGGAQELVHGFAVFAQAPVLDDNGGAQNGGIEPVVADTAHPRIDDQRVAVRLAAIRHPDQFIDVLPPVRGHRQSPQKTRFSLRADAEPCQVSAIGSPTAIG